MQRVAIMAGSIGLIALFVVLTGVREVTAAQRVREARAGRL
jgi:hypothetical protein